MPNATLETGLAALAFARRIVTGLVDDLSDAQLLHQPCPGANHPLWLLGHVAWVDDFFRCGLGGEASTLPPRWAERFAWKTRPTGDAAGYPAGSEVKSVFAAQREALVAWLRSLDEARLESPLPDDYRGFAPSFANLPSTLAWHEGFHTGQLAVVRKSLGLAPKFA